MSRMHAYAQLVRLPNLPTALADICLGALASHALPERWLPFTFLLLVSGCLYSAGMVFNDLFDLEQDRRERPFRPLPSGRVSLRTATLLGTGLLVGGVVFALLAGLSLGLVEGEQVRYTPVVLALGLVAAILLYDRWLKRTWAGPLGMGTCRFLNVLLGFSVGQTPDGVWGPHAAVVVGLYVVGVTWFARTEARESSRAALQGAAAVMLGSLLLALPLPAGLPQGTASPLFPYLLLALGLALAIPVFRAVERPTPGHVQAAVKRALFGLILLDAVLATALAGSVGLLILLLLLPALVLSRRKGLYAT